MSLDVYLRPKVARKTSCHCCGSEIDDDEPDFNQNYTHNAVHIAGIYGAVWRPEENGIVTAADLIEPLRAGIERMENDPETYYALQPENGWGSYDSFLPWLRAYLRACEEYPESLVSASR